MIALLGNLSRDVHPGRPATVGGAPFHAARALAELEAPVELYARCAEEDRGELMPPVVALGTPVRYVPGAATASFELSYAGDRRQMTVLGIGDTWLPEDVPAFSAEVRWVHAAPLARSDFPAETLAAAARGRRLSFDGQGLVRPSRLGMLEPDADFDPRVLEHVWVLKLSDEEVEVLGDPDRLPVRELLLTHGRRGATVCWNGRREHVPAFGLEVEDPTGAGDGFCISYLAARDAGFSPPAAARRATAVVASMLSR